MTLIEAYKKKTGRVFLTAEEYELMYFAIDYFGDQKIELIEKLYEEKRQDLIRYGVIQETKAKIVPLEYREIDNIEFDGIDRKDHPDYSDAFILNADYKGVPMTEVELEQINEDRGFVYERLMDHLF
jgi:hypothetical protein